MKATTNDIERERVRGALLAIIAGNNNVLNPAQVVEVARDPESPLHQYFEWDDGAAAEAYRLAQVGPLVRHVRVNIGRANPATREITLATTRAFQSRPSMRSSGGGYEPIEVILGDVAKRRELLAHVLRELAAYRKRYADLAELEPVWLAVDEVVGDDRSELSLSVAPADSESRHGAPG